MPLYFPQLEIMCQKVSSLSIQPGMSDCEDSAQVKWVRRCVKQGLKE